ncbi:metallo peptidase, MEROPS family M03A [Cyclonatronum proteinivorum]|uniref:Metallo peptidase, MEROPS family M03A n=1 Tax=Cyclonatronum proteinivorum TaxID=1457365 RepID=A0A345ULS2_9BACT|nr:M3 family metallopeptidase [Cyclonatronum proteinivorum]AXJ01424.1 metallo peptidase, MEROPS family M03A [Cyclonatronum proteinivorum]
MNAKPLQFLKRASLIAGCAAGMLISGSAAQAGTAASETKTVQTTNMTESENPFFAPSTLPFQAPDFAAIRLEHYKPAFLRGMEEQLREIEAIANNPEPPTFENTVEAREYTGALLLRTSRVFSNMSSANTSPELQAIQSEMAPLLAAHSDNIQLNNRLFERVRTLMYSDSVDELDEESRHLLTRQYRNHVRAGANLSAEQQTRMREINARLSTLATQFSESVLNTTRERAVLIETREELDGMSEGRIRAAAEAAADRGHEGKYLITLTNTTRQPVTASMTNRETRRKVWEASAFRGLGHDGHIDNRGIILEIAALRAERAEMLGFSNFAEFQLENEMAGHPDAAYQFMLDMLPAVKANTRAEADAIIALMRADGIDDDLQPWDWEYYAERVRADQFNVDENEIRPYFELERVLQDGVFYVMERQYGVTFEERFDLPVYHPDVRVFTVLDEDGGEIGLFYGDFFAREGKRGGAWMSSYVVQNHLKGDLPVVVNVLNIAKAPEGEPQFVTLSNVVTLFHEMGHGVHGLFSDVRFPSLAGTATPRDFVEFPSTYEEDWAIDPEVLRNYALHYETGEPIPLDLLDRFLEARQFNQGFDTFEYIAAALLDLDWHTLTSQEIPTDVEAFERASLARHGVDWPFVPPRYTSGTFNHVWPGGYAASYYAYLWSEVLAADAFEYVQQSGGLGSEIIRHYQNTVLSSGGSRDPMELYRDFRGQDPTVDALLRRRGLDPTPVN